MFKKYWGIILLLSIAFIFLIAGCVSYIREKKELSELNLGFYELEQEFPEYSQLIKIPKIKKPPPIPLPIISSLYLDDSVCDFLDLAFYEEKVYAVFCRAKDNFKLFAKEFNGNKWENIGSNPITNSQAYWANIEIINNLPVVFYVDQQNNYSISGKIYENTWRKINTDSLPKSATDLIKTHSHNDSLFLAYCGLTTGNLITAFWNNNQWTLLPQLSKYGHQIIDLDIITIKDSVYLAIIDGSNAYNVLVYKLYNNSWNQVGHFPLIDFFVGDLSLATDGKNPYISYITYKDFDSSYKVNVKKYTGRFWENVGEPFSTPGKARFSELQIHKKNIFLAYADLTNKKPIVLQLTNNKWKPITEPKDALGNTSKLLHFIFKNFSYVAYIDEANNHRPIAMPLPLRELL